MSTPSARAGAELMLGSIHESDQEIHLEGVVTHTRSRAVRMPWWALVLLAQIVGVDEIVRAIVSAVV